MKSSGIFDEIDKTITLRDDCDRGQPASLADIQGAIGARIDDGDWISTSYLVAEIVVIPLTGRLAPIFSLRIYLLTNAEPIALWTKMKASLLSAHLRRSSMCIIDQDSSSSF